VAEELRVNDTWKCDLAPYLRKMLLQLGWK